MRKFIDLFLLITAIFTVSVVFGGCSPTPHQLSTSVVPSGSGTISPSEGLFAGQVTLVASPARYYKFDGWAGSASGNTNPLTVTMNSDKQIAAQFTKIKYNLQTQTDSPNGVTVQPSGAAFDAGIQVKVTATPANGYRFDHWGGSTAGTVNPMSVLVDGDKTITAYFIRQYILKVSSDPGDSGRATPGTGLYDAGTQVKLGAVPLFPFYPKNWMGADNNDVNIATVTMSGDRSVTAIFAPTIKGQLQKFSGDVAGGDLAVGPPHSPIASIPIQLKQYEWVQGEIIVGTNPPVSAYVQDPNGKVIKDFGAPGQANFTFWAEIAGRYSFVFKNTSMFWSVYSLSYTIFQVPQ
jgi:hypothetical protein